MFGVKIADLKVIAKKIKHNQELALQLYDTGNSDAMYLAGLVANGSGMTKKQIEDWAKSASWQMISDYTVPWVATESPYARELALKWMKSKHEQIASTGWFTYAGIVATRSDDELDMDEVEGLLQEVEKNISRAPNRVRYAMNNFVIAVGGCVKPLLKRAKMAAKKIGKVDVDMGDTSCKVPLATEYIDKIEKAGRVGRKRATTKC
jgi:3-methyladenine DNA glycosylase AlkD